MDKGVGITVEADWIMICKVTVGTNVGALGIVDAGATPTSRFKHSIPSSDGEASRLNPFLIRSLVQTAHLFSPFVFSVLWMGLPRFLVLKKLAVILSMRLVFLASLPGLDGRKLLGLSLARAACRYHSGG